MQKLNILITGGAGYIGSDVSGLINDFGYKPDNMLADGIGEFVKWYRDFYGENK